MVSFWPFKGDGGDFEKVLSELSGKITRTSARQDRFRQQQRRYKVLWTLYTTFAYILTAAILTLVTGWETWDYTEYTAVAGGPVLIYGVRTLIDTYYNYRISGHQHYLNDLTKQREVAIDKLKAATKYNSTQELLDKYGGSTPKRLDPSPQAKGKRKSDVGPQGASNTPQSGRTGFAPPPTANIPGRQAPPALAPAQQNLSSAPGSPNVPTFQHRETLPLSGGRSHVGEEFAPNAFAATTRPPTQSIADGSKWYDRILDVLVGEDETSAKNRLVLLCRNCRLVNGQAPPGVRTLEEVGRWRCSACNTWNGVESEDKRILGQISRGEASATTPVDTGLAEPGLDASRVLDEDAEYVEVEDEDDDINGEEADAGASDEAAPPASSTRSKARQRKQV